MIDLCVDQKPGVLVVDDPLLTKVQVTAPRSRG